MPSPRTSATSWIFPSERPNVINESELLVTALVGEVTSASMETNPYQVDANGVPLATSSLTGGAVRTICWSSPTTIPPMVCPTDGPFFFVTPEV